MTSVFASTTFICGLLSSTSIYVPCASMLVHSREHETENREPDDRSAIAKPAAVDLHAPRKYHTSIGRRLLVRLPRNGAATRAPARSAIGGRGGWYVLRASSILHPTRTARQLGQVHGGGDHPVPDQD